MAESLYKARKDQKKDRCNCGKDQKAQKSSISASRINEIEPGAPE